MLTVNELFVYTMNVLNFSFLRQGLAMYIAKASVELLGSSNPPDSQVARTKGATTSSCGNKYP